MLVAGALLLAVASATAGATAGDLQRAERGHRCPRLRARATSAQT
jgi:hypothetical protein